MTEKLSDGKKITVGIGIVSWKSHETLRKTLESYRQAELIGLFDRAVIFFQDMDNTDRAIAQKFGIEAIGGPNVGIAEGMRQHALHMNTDFVLFMENDCPLVENIEIVKKRLSTALDLLAQKKIDIMRLRHCWHVGQGFQAIEKYCRYFPIKNMNPRLQYLGEFGDLTKDTFKRFLNRTLRPGRAKNVCGRSVYLEKEPHLLFPELIKKVETDEDLYIVDSSCLNWTNQSVLCSAGLFLNKLMPYVDANPSSRTSNGFQSPERPLNCKWWQDQHFQIGVGEGLFSHNRFDGSWRV